ncbi:MAG: alpha/beta fold hydrolase [Acidobacteria bacterium]|nr:MAG: alpha/beta fold hydrolase [Acidobacteriota bacterium]REK04011.1 MAG: alpha/beta fold hydrolase [Acidobacteriota bacterium]REK15173.1 MAG: alpha/beta fold hydrolase [Acidobacteriota bacterium]REK46263.1 MAG: alpha/beta fold hydrolase [Acidobacteriota bacterium]
MYKVTRLVKSVVRLFLPVAVSIVVLVMGASVWLVHSTSTPPRNEYLVTPEVYGRLSSHAAQVTEETWQNRDGSSSRGWLLRGRKDYPAVILLHKYGADRSYVLNLGVKLSEATDFTVLMPDQRGHGQNPPVQSTSFGGCEVNDTLAAIDYLRSLRDANRDNLVGEDIGIYGVEMGALAALATSSKDQSVRAVVLDSVPQQSDDLIDTVVAKRYPFLSSVTSSMARNATYIYYAGSCYERQSVCEVARTVKDRRALLLSGQDVPGLKQSTDSMAGCFPSDTKVQSFTDLTASGVDLVNVSPDKADSYDQKVIYFFQENLKTPPPPIVDDPAQGDEPASEGEEDSGEI